jgi:RNA polymerase sigma factor (sigma-70 family)
MTSDLDLLGQYARENSQDAFGEIVRRHLDLVYSAALRQVRSPQLAEEVAQSVFADLARVAATPSSPAYGRNASLPNSLTPWLYAVTRRTAIDVIRKESRRRLREQIAVEMNSMNATSAGWTHIAPLLDDAMAALDETDRSAILLRYFENKSLREVGEALGASEDTAQKRVSRAVERLRVFFSKRNVTIGVSGLAVLISANAVQSAPVGLGTAISASAALSAVHHATTIGLTKTMAMTMITKTVIATTLAVAIGTGIFEAHHYLLAPKIWKLRQQLHTNEFRNVGRETPEAAAETVLWAAYNKPSELANMVLLPPEMITDGNRKIVGEQLAKEIVRETEAIQGPTHQVWLDGGDLTRVIQKQANDQIFQYNNVVAFRLVSLQAGKEHFNPMYMIKVDGIWKMVIPGLSPETQ